MNIQRIGGTGSILGGSDRDLRPGAVKSADLNTLKSEAAAAPR